MAVKRKYRARRSLDKVEQDVSVFVISASERVKRLDHEELVKDGINPLLIRALGINDFKPLAKFLVYQRLGRSFVTSFGTVLEHIVRDASGGKEYKEVRKGDRRKTGKKKKWWDVVKHEGRISLYMSVKSGPNDMDKDQLRYWVKEAKKIIKKDPRRNLPVIAICYGKAAAPIITSTLLKAGLSPEKHVLVGRMLFKRITGTHGYYDVLPGLVSDASNKAIAGYKVTKIMDRKCGQVARQLKKKYRTIERLLQSVY